MVSMNTLKERVNLFVSGRNLKNLDVMSRSDPRCLLFEKTATSWAKIGETETIQNNLNPDFQTSFTVDYFFEKTQHFRFVFIDSDNASGSDYDEIGDVEVVMGKLMGAPKQVWTEDLKRKGETRGKIVVRTQTIASGGENFVVSFVPSWRNVNNMGGGCMGMCQERQPYQFHIMKSVPGSNDRFAVAHTAPRVFNTDSVHPGKISQSLGDLCNSDKTARIKFCLQNRETNEEYHSAITTIAELEGGKMTHPAGGECTLTFDQLVIRQRPKFVDYLRSGWQIGLTFAIDYTASNREPTDPNSLHAIGPNNQYIQAINSVGAICEPYDQDRMFPVFGFGGMHRGMGMTSASHCFPINANANNPEVFTVQAVAQTYIDTLPSISLQGPTYFAPLLNEFLRMMESRRGQPQYQILLILTDGAIHDMRETKDLVYRLSSHSCSIIIVGVGNADFSMMEELDGDGGTLRNSSGQACPRDIVQFVRFNECMRRGNLAEQVLKEVPNQLVSFMENNGIYPAPIEQVLPPAQFVNAPNPNNQGAPLPGIIDEDAIMPAQ